MSSKFPHASEGAFDTGWLLALTNIHDMITRELRAAQAKGWDLKLTHETTAAGEEDACHGGGQEPAARQTIT